jgi:hypothetical protein
MMKKIETFQGIVKGFNTLQCNGKLINCWKNPVEDHGVRRPLDLFQYVDEVVEVEGMLESDLWEAKFVKKFNKAKEARSLNDLMRIRAVNREAIEKVNGNLGTALGYKWSRKENTKHPCIIIFVPEKKSSETVSQEEAAPKVLMSSDGTWCLTDVVPGGKVSKKDFKKLSELSPENKKIVKELQSGSIRLVGGIKLVYYIDNSKNVECEDCGTAGIAVKNKNGEIGFLTNQHVVGDEKRDFYHPDFGSSKIAVYESSKSTEVDYIDFASWYGGILDEPKGKVIPDYAFLEILKNKIPEVEPGLHRIGKVGPLKRIDPNTMDIIGQNVISIGCKRGIQRGYVAAYSYEYIDSDEYDNFYTDLLIIGRCGSAFSDKGDSGKIIVTDDDLHSPIGLHTGGWQGRFHKDMEIEKWGYALDLGKVLNRLDLEIYEK